MITMTMMTCCCHAGRLGNQMSAYATLYAFSEMYGLQHLVTQVYTRTLYSILYSVNCVQLYRHSSLFWSGGECT